MGNVIATNGLLDRGVIWQHEMHEMDHLAGGTLVEIEFYFIKWAMDGSNPYVAITFDIFVVNIFTLISSAGCQQEGNLISTETMDCINKYFRILLGRDKN